MGTAAFVFLRAQHTLDRTSVSVAEQGHFRVELRSLGPQPNPGFEAIASPATYNAGAFYQGKLYVSGPAGLFVYGTDSTRGGLGITLLKSYRVGLDLPAAPLGRMVVGRLRGETNGTSASQEQVLMIATLGEGVLLFSGTHAADGGGSFRQLRAQDADARDVTALLPLPTGELLIGTPRRGLLVYRGGANLESFHAQLSGLCVTALAADAAGFWLGTANQGVRHLHGGEIESFDVTGGALPDNQVDALAVQGNKIYIGTPLGVEEMDDGRPARVLARNAFAHALFADGDGLIIGSVDQGFQRVSLSAIRRPGAATVDTADLEQRGENSSGPAEQFLRLDAAGKDSELFAVMRNSLRRQQSGGAWMPLVADMAQAGKSAILTDGNISALAFDPDGRLWVGYFDRGLDIVTGDTQRTEHHEDDHLFCVNRIALDPRRNTMAVATANGLVLFDRQDKPRQVMTKRDGLIADHVTDVAFTANSMVLGTPAGLTFVDATGARSLYAFEGLVNNHVYALGVQLPGGTEPGQAGSAGTVLAGTLGGISVLRDESVKRNLTAANSGLKHNWVTAIVPIADSEGSWMVGTYGAGVMRLDKDGRFAAMEGATRSMVVNSTAMLVAGDHVFAGTLGQGLWKWSRGSDRWEQITAGLPSRNVTALAEHQGELYVGTDNGLVRIAESRLD